MCCRLLAAGVAPDDSTDLPVVQLLGKGGTGGTVTNAKNPLRSRGAAGMNPRYQRITSGVQSSGQKVGPAWTVEAGCARKRNEVTTPKFPPPPRNAQNRSGFSSALARAWEPSASTTSAASRLSMVRPHFPLRYPRPPPRVSPPTPVVEMIPAGTASPNWWVAASSLPGVQPPPARTVRAAGSTSTASRRARSTTMSPSQTPAPRHCGLRRALPGGGRSESRTGLPRRRRLGRRTWR